MPAWVGDGGLACRPGTQGARLAGLQSAGFADELGLPHRRAGLCGIASPATSLRSGPPQPTPTPQAHTRRPPPAPEDKPRGLLPHPLGPPLQGAVLASDAFFPFSWNDSVEIACQAGVGAIVHPGGSVRDQDAIDCCNKYGVALLTTGVRHFKCVGAVQGCAALWVHGCESCSSLPRGAWAHQSALLAVQPVLVRAGLDCLTARALTWLFLGEARGPADCTATATVARPLGLLAAAPGPPVASCSI